MTGRRYRRQAPEERSAERRDRLLRAALELFGTDGYAATPVSRLCAEAGLSTRQLYEEFDGRESLLRALYDAINELAVQAVAAAVDKAGGEPLETRIGVGIAAYIGSVTADPRCARVVFVEVIGVSEEFELHRRDWRHRWSDVLAAELPAPDPDELRLTLTAFTGAVHALASEWSLDGGDTSLDAITDTLVGLLIGALRHRSG